MLLFVVTRLSSIVAGKERGKFPSFLLSMDSKNRVYAPFGGLGGNSQHFFIFQKNLAELINAFDTEKSFQSFNLRGIFFSPLEKNINWGIKKLFGVVFFNSS